MDNRQWTVDNIYCTSVSHGDSQIFLKENMTGFNNSFVVLILGAVIVKQSSRYLCVPTYLTNHLNNNWVERIFGWFGFLTSQHSFERRYFLDQQSASPPFLHGFKDSVVKPRPALAHMFQVCLFNITVNFLSIENMANFPKAWPLQLMLNWSFCP